jgi:uncharacterized protein YbjT (DUF2867 family)
MSSDLRNVAVFGAGGNNVGHHVLKTLLSQPDHFNVSVLARASSKTTFPSNVKVIRLPDNPSEADYVSAFRDIDAIVSAVGYPAKIEEKTLIDAAVAAGVKRFIPSEYGLVNSYPAARQLNPVFAAKADTMEYLQTKEKEGLSWTVIPTGLWLDWCINLVPVFGGFDAKAHRVHLWDGGEHRLSFTTLPWVAEAIAQILRNPDSTKNKIFPVRAFEASQKEVVAALEREQGVKYEVVPVDGQQMIADGKKKWEAGDSTGIMQCIQAGFLLKGFGSNLQEELVVKVGSDKLDLPKLSLDQTVKESLKELYAK